MRRSPVHKPVRNLSGIGQARGEKGIVARGVAGSAWGGRGSLNRCFAAPGPLSALVFPLAFARVLAIRVAPARFRTRGQGHTPAPRKRDTELLSSQMRFQASTPSRCTRGHSGQQRVFRDVWVFRCFLSHYGRQEESIGTLTGLDVGVCTAGGQVASSDRTPTGAAVRSRCRGTISRAGDRVLRVTRRFISFPS